MDTRFKNSTYNLADNDGRIGTWEKVGIAALYDIRDELQTLNRLLQCPNFTQIPRTLKSIQQNTTRKRKPAKKARAKR